MVCIEEKRNPEFWWENMNEGGHVGDPGIYEKIMLTGCSGDRMGGCGLYLSGSGQEPVVGNRYVPVVSITAWNS